MKISRLHYQILTLGQRGNSCKNWCKLREQTHQIGPLLGRGWGGGQVGNLTL